MGDAVRTRAGRRSDTPSARQEERETERAWGRDQSLIDRWVAPDPRRGACDARLVGSGIPVWVLLRYMHAARGDAAAVVSELRVPREAVDAALAYYGRHQVLLDLRLTLAALHGGTGEGKERLHAGRPGAPRRAW